ncbi:nucleotidyltransferase family protein [Flavobacterium sp.]|uniref:nucleotidyltransferase family protein n=1 Tax=Flavobacterium sp. TaxID=239 RepID=UPI0039E2B03C
MNLINQNINKLSQLCNQHKVEHMYLFGSATNSTFSDESDIDFLVKFKSSEIKDYFSNYLTLKTNLANLLGREVDLVEEQALKNPILIRSINKSKELIYG